MMQEKLPYKDRSLLIRLVGLGLLAVGTFSLLLAPLEIQTLSFFSAGGRFEYEGFGFGSLMFGNIVAQVFGYYLIVLLCIPLGIGHLKLRHWARKITLTLLYDWLVLGLALTIIVFLILLSSKDLPPESLPILVIGFFLLYPVLPIMLVLFYRWRDVRLSFRGDDPVSVFVEDTPQSILVIGSLMVFFTLALHVPILFNGLFPFFGGLLSDYPGVIAIDLSVVILLILTWGVFKQRRWAWWGSVVYFSVMVLSATLTFLTTEPREMFEKMNLAGLERDIIQNVPSDVAYLLFLFILPIAITLLLLILSGRQFGGTDPRAQ